MTDSAGQAALTAENGLMTKEGRKEIAHLAVWAKKPDEPLDRFLTRQAIERRVERVLERIAKKWEREHDQDAVREVHIERRVENEAQ
jgi:hypothetical protein